MEMVSCILCGSSRSTQFLTQRDLNLARNETEFTVVRCGDCSLLYLNPRPTPSEIRNYYPPEYYSLDEAHQPRKIDRVFKRLSNALKKGIMVEFYGYPPPPGMSTTRLVSALRRLILWPEYWHLKVAGRDIIPFQDEGRILDVGCGPGKVMRVLRDRGWDVHGVDFSSVAVEHARARWGLNVTCGDLQQAHYKDDYFDVVMFNHSLEHMYNPLGTLHEAYRILKPGGLLFVTLPNAGSFEAWLFGRWWVHWDVPRHLYHFTYETMSRLVEQAGFRVSNTRGGVGTSFFLGSLDYVYKYVLKWKCRHGGFSRHFVAGPVCLLMGHLGRSGEMKMTAQKGMS
jgi:SAM-dependent methyltransferase